MTTAAAAAAVAGETQPTVALCSLSLNPFTAAGVDQLRILVKCQSLTWAH